MTTISPPSTVARHLAGLFTNSPSALLSDFDGTLSLVAPTPGEAELAPGAADAIAALTHRLDLVGIVTGRGIVDAMARIAVPNLVFAGNHGLEWFEGGVHGVDPAGVAAAAVLTDVLAEVERTMADEFSLDGLIFENKTYSGSIHYRLAPDPVRAGEVLTQVVEDVARTYGMWVSTGKMVVEVRPVASINKGTATRRLVESHDLRSAAFFGDDITDSDAFVALREMREVSDIETCAVAVLSADAHPLVVERSDFVLAGVDDVVAVFSMLADLMPVRANAFSSEE